MTVRQNIAIFLPSVVLSFITNHSTKMAQALENVMWQAEFKLYLYPEDPDAPVENAGLKSTLADCKFIGPLIEKNRYQAGEQFLSLLCFMGCSPNIELEPQNDRPYCYIEIPESSAEKRFIAGRNTRKLQCPGCKQTVNNAKALINDAIENKVDFFECPECNQRIDLETINWRKSAFIAKSWIAVGNIYEAEAIPDDKLLGQLELATGNPWKFAYIREEPTAS